MTEKNGDSMTEKNKPEMNLSIKTYTIEYYVKFSFLVSVFALS